MKIITSLCLLLVLMGTANADVYSDNAKAAQVVADSFFIAIADKDYEIYKTKVTDDLVTEYNANNANNKIKRWWDSARNNVEKFNATWEFAKVKTNTPTNIALDYKRTMSTGITTNTIYLTKKGDKWLVDGAGSI